MARGFDEPWEAYVERVKREAFHVAPPTARPVQRLTAVEEADQMIAAMNKRQIDRARAERRRANRAYQKRRAA